MGGKGVTVRTRPQSRPTRRARLGTLVRRTRARAVVAAGGASLTSGVWLEFGKSWGLVAGGVLGIAYGLLLIDVDEEGRSG